MTQRAAFENLLRCVTATDQKVLTPVADGQKKVSSNCIAGLNDCLMFNQRMLFSDKRFYISDYVKENLVIDSAAYEGLSCGSNVNLYNLQVMYFKRDHILKDDDIRLVTDVPLESGQVKRRNRPSTTDLYSSNIS